MQTGITIAHRSSSFAHVLQIQQEVEIDSRWFSTTWEEFSEKGIDDDHIFIQSLRGDPFTAFNFSVLAASHSSKSSTIVKLNLLKQLED
mmetsp:Transcript_6917/g.10202  ORF Transcript_6917/g.10202 Transcript_6917/m.10202 type:complete len:89 (+) Transcript_6917:107-373(+)